MEEPTTAPVLQRQWLQQWHASGLADRLAVFEHRLQTLPGQEGRSEVTTDSGGAPARVREAHQPNLLQEFADRLAAQDAAMEDLRAQVARDKDAAAAAVTALHAQLHQEKERGQGELAQLRAQVEQEKEELQAQIRDSTGQYEGPAPVPEQLLSLTADLQRLTNRAIKHQVTNRLTELMQEVITIKQHLDMTPPTDLEARATDHRGQSDAARHDDWQDDDDTVSYNQYLNFREEYLRWRDPESRWRRRKPTEKGGHRAPPLNSGACRRRYSQYRRGTLSSC